MLEAYNRRDLAAVAVNFQPDLEYYPYREFVEAGLTEPCYHGPAGYRAYIESTYEVWGPDVRLEPTELIDAIRKVRGGQFIINEKIFSRPAVASKVLAEFRELSVYGPGSTHVFAPLSPREVQILDNIAQGMTNKEVAYALAISEQTVKNHMSSILRKLSVNDRTQAVVYAIRQGWIKGPEMGN